jgi:hypothetical protein
VSFDDVMPEGYDPSEYETPAEEPTE